MVHFWAAAPGKQSDDRITPFIFYKDQWKYSEPGKEIEKATSKITKMSLNIGRFRARRRYKLYPYKKKTVFF